MPMPSGDEIQSSLRASWALMLGRRDALRQLDLSEDGFWRSFYAFVIAAPAMFVYWAREATQTAPGSLAERFGVVIRLALMEAAMWIAPLLAIALVLYRIGKRDRVAAFVIANNWGSALLAWVMLPFVLLTMPAPGLGDAGMLLLLVVFIAMLVFVWRLNNAVLDMGPMAPTGVVVALVGLSLVIDYLLRAMLAIPSLDQPV